MEESEEKLVLSEESNNYELKENIMVPIACSTIVDKIEIIDSGILVDEPVTIKSDLEVKEDRPNDKKEQTEETCDIRDLLFALNKNMLKFNVKLEQNNLDLKSEMNNKFEQVKQDNLNLNDKLDRLDKNNLDLKTELKQDNINLNDKFEKINLELKTELKAECNKSIAEIREVCKEGFNEAHISLDRWNKSLDNYAVELRKEIIILNNKDEVCRPIVNEIDNVNDYKVIEEECRPSATQALVININKEILESFNKRIDNVVGIDLVSVNSEVSRPKSSLNSYNKNKRLGLGKFKMKLLGIFFDNNNNEFVNVNKAFEFDNGVLYNKNNFVRNSISSMMIGRCFKSRKKKMKYLVLHENDYNMVYDLGYCFTILENMLWNILGCTDFNNGKILFEFYKDLLKNKEVVFKQVNGVMNIFSREVEDYKFAKEVSELKVMNMELRLGEFVSAVIKMLMFLKVIFGILNFEVIQMVNEIFVLVLKRLFKFNVLKKDKSFYTKEELFKMSDGMNFGFFDGNRKSINKVSTTVKFIKNIKV